MRTARAAAYFSFGIAAALLVAWSAPARAAGTIAVLPLAARGVDPSLALNLTDLLVAGLSEGGWRVLGPVELRSKLDRELKQTMENCEELECYLAIGEFAFVDKVVGGHVGVVGSTHLLSLRLIDIASGQVENRLSATVKGGEGRLIQGVQEAGRALMEGYATITLGEETRPRQPAPSAWGDEASPPRRNEPPPERYQPPANPEALFGEEAVAKVEGKAGVIGIMKWVTGGLAVACAGGAIATGMIGRSKADEYNSSYYGVEGPKEDLKSSAEQMALLTNVMIGVGSAAAAASITLFVLDAVLGGGDFYLAPVPAGAGLAVGGGF